MKHIKGISGMFVLLLVLIIIFVAAAGYLGYQLFYVKNTAFIPNISTAPTASPTPVPGAEFGISPTKDPIVYQPLPGTKVTSPLTIKGTVPPGWMNEGVFPISIQDSTGNILVRGEAKEDKPGSWQSGQPATFTAVLTFTTSDTSGLVTLDSDNPSGDPNTGKSLSVPVNF